MQPRVMLRIVVGCVCAAVATAGCGGSSGGTSTPDTQTTAPSTAKPTLLWPAPKDPLKRAVAAGLEPEVKESLTFHVHAHLDVFVDGKPVLVPSGIGINITDPGVKRFDNPDGTTGYGGIEGCASPCISPLHTHDATGILHTEAKTPKPNTLGQFFTEWGVRLTSTCVADFCDPDTSVAVYVDGKRYSGDPAAIELTFEEEIAVVVGTPPAVIPDSADFSNA